MLQRTPVKIIITDEMLTDYETLFGRLLPKKLHDFVWDENIEEIYCPKPPIDDIVTELKDYIEFRQQSRAPFDDYYFRVKEFDVAPEIKSNMEVLISEDNKTIFTTYSFNILYMQNELSECIQLLL